MNGVLLIPFKSLATAKQRLAEALNAQQRSQFAEAMLRDVLTAATGVQNRIDIAVVTGDAHARMLAREAGCLVIEDTRNVSETAAIAAFRTRDEVSRPWAEPKRQRKAVAP